MTTSCVASTENKITLTVDYGITDETGTKRLCDNIVSEMELKPFQSLRRYSLPASGVDDMVLEAGDATKIKLVVVEITTEPLTVAGISMKLGNDPSDPTLLLQKGQATYVFMHKLTGNALSFVNNELFEVSMNILIGDIIE